eukprot:746531-Hanusia_phi.AAC.3
MHTMCSHIEAAKTSDVPAHTSIKHEEDSESTFESEDELPFGLTMEAWTRMKPSRRKQLASLWHSIALIEELIVESSDGEKHRNAVKLPSLEPSQLEANIVLAQHDMTM